MSKQASRHGGSAPPQQPVQLAFDLPCRAALGAEDFLISPSNEEAVTLIDRWPDWHHWAVVICGPAQAGKSHLANVWRLKSGAVTLDPLTMAVEQMGAAITAAAIVVEDIDRGFDTVSPDIQGGGTAPQQDLGRSRGQIDQQAFFHLLNLAREHRLSVLITSRVAPGDLDIALPDLRSRLCALPMAVIHEPDEHLLRAVLVKHFSDRQLNVEPAVIDYLMLYMERSMGAAAQVVARIDARTLASRRKVSQKLASEVLVAMMAGDGDDNEPRA